MSTPVTELQVRLAELEDLHAASRLLHWDQDTMMPPRGGAGRAETLATLGRISHQLFVADETGRLLDAAAASLDGADAASDDARMVLVTRRNWEKARRVPSELEAELARAASIGQAAWVDARKRSDFAAFAPHLERNLELKRRYVDCFDGFPGFECSYDVVLDDFEAGMRTAHVQALFEELKAELIPLIATLKERAADVDVSCLHGSFPVEAQRVLARSVLDSMGFDADGWRLDDAVHPFATSMSPQDVRITTRWDESFWASAIFGAMHECGHGLYEEGIASSLQRTPIGNATALALHESQSRLWENMVGRSAAFAPYLAGRVTDAFGAGPDPRALFRAVNRVAPSFIRVEADEATYGLHVILRFELEQELLESRLAVADLPEAWNARFERSFGLKVTDDADGVLQDVHWAAGLIGYFPTYAIGNLVAGQLWAITHEQLPELDAQIAQGQLKPLREWLRERVHRHGSKFTTEELVRDITGGPIAVQPFVGYLRAKLADAYDG
jgi:carboxypeptidase Taq